MRGNHDFRMFGRDLMLVGGGHWKVCDLVLSYRIYIIELSKINVHEVNQCFLASIGPWVMQDGNLKSSIVIKISFYYAKSD